MPTYIITLGSNTPDREERVEGGLRWLRENLSVISATGVYSSPDAYHSQRPPYANAIVVARAEAGPDELDSLFKAYELEQGRDRSTGIVPLDLDVVVKDLEILRPRDYHAPYFILGLPLLATLPVPEK